MNIKDRIKSDSSLNFLLNELDHKKIMDYFSETGFLAHSSQDDIDDYVNVISVFGLPGKELYYFRKIAQALAISNQIRKQEYKE